jgi:hypothetical protein
MNMGQVRESRAAAVALIALCAVISLACASMIGAVAVLVVTAAEKPVPSVALARNDAVGGGAGLRRAVFSPLRAPRKGECTVVIWNTGMVYCVRDKPAQAAGEERPGSAVVMQVQADD